MRSGRGGLINVSVGLGRDRETVTVKNRGGKHLRIDGPFPETKELVGGFDIIDFDSYEEAIEYAKYEEAHQSLVIEVRPIREFWWISQTFGQAASKIFMLTSVEDERAALSIPESERKQIYAAASGRRRGIRRESRDARSGARIVGRGAVCRFPTQAKTIRWKNGGRHVTDGPFAETKEVAGGFNLVACASIDEAITWANKLAAARRRRDRSQAGRGMLVDLSRMSSR